MHNANILFMAVEFMLNDLPISYWHFPFVLVYGMLYVLFSWVFHHYHGYYYYFFLDYSKPYAIFWYLGLFAVVLFFFMLSYVISSILHHYMDSILPSVVSVGEDIFPIICMLMDYSSSPLFLPTINYYIHLTVLSTTYLC